ncbi:hypothetical protein ISN44_As09g015830 [Arabidopsis suecica]|uniref:Uncharacterized protein n=1 Tax=Arabidopsis suecica TaxID=45249 RepID=A0A8T2AKP3_ARASU|nr:hypothetical protein ISN44_As09g015830 [Arabidopsis suecica]
MLKQIDPGEYLMTFQGEREARGTPSQRGRSPNVTLHLRLLAAPALAFVAIRLTRLRQDDVGMSVSSTGSCSSPGSSTGSNSVPAPFPALAPAGSRCS